MMSEKDGWLPIEEIPASLMDGREVYVKREYGGCVFEGLAVFWVCHADAPQRRPLGPDPLGRPIDYAAEARDILAFADERKWLKPNRMYSFPTPTHFRLNTSQAL